MQAGGWGSDYNDICTLLLRIDRNEFPLNTGAIVRSHFATIRLYFRATNVLESLMARSANPSENETRGFGLVVRTIYSYRGVSDTEGTCPERSVPGAK